jgi:GT2 family glycosyltransferase/glycosyltransferase involved in cell wall biosynthesis
MQLESVRGLDLDALARVGAGTAWPPAPPLPTATHVPPRKLAICVASHDLVGPIRNGGIGTAYTALAEALAADGHRVTALYLQGAYCEQQTPTYWEAWYRARGVEFVPLPSAPERLATTNGWVRAAYDTLCWLRDQPFDMVHFPEWLGAAYFCLLAKHQGLAFAATTFVLGTHSPTAWQRQGNCELMSRYADLETDFMERRCLELADVVWSPSQYLLRWERDRDWKLPAATYVQPYLAPTRVGPAAATTGREPVRELVFFGRLEERKGLVFFCDALEKLAAKTAMGRSLDVTFLGKEAEVHGKASRQYLAERSRRLPFRTRILTDRDRQAALEYLRGPGRLAVMPSLMENLPFTVIECLDDGIPFLASTVGGIPELLAPDQHARMLVPLRADLWADALGRVLAEGAERGRPAFDREANRSAWLSWHARLPAVVPANQIPVSTDAGKRPLVSVCMPHHNRPRLLGRALDSLRKQDYPRLEVIVVDDASTDPAAQPYLDKLEVEFAERGWKLERSPVNRFATGARNAAARLARGEYLLFMDDDNVAKPHEVSTLVRAAEHTGAELVTCFADIFEGDEVPASGRPTERNPFLGPAVGPGLWYNTLGDTNTLMRRETFFALGGFTEDYGLSHEDHEFLVRAVLRGFRLEVVPEALFWYRRTPDGVNLTSDPAANRLRVLRPYLEAVPAELRPALQLAQGLMEAAIAGENWRNRPRHYRALDRLVAAMQSRAGFRALLSCLARWAVAGCKRVFKRSARPQSEPVPATPTRRAA